MVARSLENTEVSVCEKCNKRFECFTNRSQYDGLCNPENFEKLTPDVVRQIHIAKAKRQGHYFPTNKAG
jgi:hypothetical protein